MADKSILGVTLNVDMDFLKDGAENLGKGALKSFKSNFTKAWDSLTDDEQKAAQALLVSIGKVRLLEIAGHDVSSFLPILDSALLQWKAVASGEAVSAFKAVAGEVVGLGAQFVSTVLRGALRI